MPTQPRLTPRAAALCAAVLFAAPAASAAEISVAVSIAPAHSLTVMVAGERAEATLLVPPDASPHDFALRPSAARALAEADVVIGVGAGLDGFLDAPIRALGEDARILVLSAAPGVTLLPIRESVLWEAEDHHADHDGPHDTESHARHMADPDHRATHEAEHGDDHDEAHDDAHGGSHAGDHDEIHGDSHDDDDGHHHAHAHPEGAADPHIWLDPANARAWLAAIADALSAADPEGAPVYAANAAAADARLAALDAQLHARLAPVADRPYAVFHDAYQYFERRFGLTALGAVSGVDAAAPSPRRLSGIRAAIRDSGAVCVFSEPQFDPALIKVAVEGTDARIATLDPLGASIPAGPDQYPLLMEALGANVAECLGG